MDGPYVDQKLNSAPRRLISGLVDEWDVEGPMLRKRFSVQTSGTRRVKECIASGEANLKALLNKHIP